MEPVGYGSNDNRLRVWEKLDYIVCHSDSNHSHQRLLSAITIFLGLSDKESVVVSPVITVHNLRKKGEI